MSEYFELFLAFLGTGAVSFMLYYVTLKEKDEATAAVFENKDKAEMKRLKQELKDDKWTWQNMLMSKWMSFGGGFYGVIAVLTYVVVEFKEVFGFITSEGSVLETITSLSISDFVNLFVNSIMNFVTAIAWPAYWLNSISRQSIWVWFGVVYAGYLVGQFIAKNTINPYAVK